MLIEPPFEKGTGSGPVPCSSSTVTVLRRYSCWACSLRQRSASSEASGPRRRAGEIAQVCGKILITDLVEVIASLFIDHDHQTLRATQRRRRRSGGLYNSSCPHSIDLSTVSTLISPTLPT